MRSAPASPLLYMQSPTVTRPSSVAKLNWRPPPQLSHTAPNGLTKAAPAYRLASRQVSMSALPERSTWRRPAPKIQTDKRTLSISGEGFQARQQREIAERGENQSQMQETLLLLQADKARLELEVLKMKEELAQSWGDVEVLACALEISKAMESSAETLRLGPGGVTGRLVRALGCDMLKKERDRRFGERKAADAARLAQEARHNEALQRQQALHIEDRAADAREIAQLRELVEALRLQTELVAGTGTGRNGTTTLQEI